MPDSALNEASACSFREDNLHATPATVRIGYRDRGDTVSVFDDFVVVHSGMVLLVDGA